MIFNVTKSKFRMIKPFKSEDDMIDLAYRRLWYIKHRLQFFDE